ncbi:MULTISPECIES: ABC transporter ATP-binding protein [unclassified Rhodococcus (in: high G+C Gram-positive bacteria)]|uniref:ABC transporter ATP-binding protein n=1 Tax=unclassified Rhodococcus (in: high G+C Gram-positive bacteria) TaxID=192944 RepID=UPI0007BC7224|nr:MULTISPECIES: ABC transporter ATP-binding protein [unclassified Rhodococcus (in: high G+C Gram-positive bacteria)]KZE98272.1 ABC transporter permease [Rhodococcus sp. EPR-147]KZF06868.1 ABC transporter permease [Rhodococcus sp. EPR-279]OZE18690.1 ABC transporter ATP-binding protein [Rhodococcus sp. 05-2254-6]
MVDVQIATAEKKKITVPNLRVLWQFVRPHRRTLSLGLTLGLVGTGAALATPMVAKGVLDGLGTDASLIQPVLILVALLVVGSLVLYLQWIVLGVLAERVVLDARKSIVRKYFGATVGSLGTRPTGELVTRVTSDTVLLREATSNALVAIVNSVVGLVGALILMAVLDLVLLGAIASAIIAIAVLFARLMPPIAVAQRQSQEAVGRLGGILDGTLRAIRTVKSSRAEARESERVISEARISAQHSVRAVKISALAWTFAGGGVQLAIIGILGLGGYRVSTGALAVSSLIAFLLYAFQVMGPVSTLATNITALQAGMAAAARIRQIDDLVTEKGETGPARSARTETPAPALEFRSVTARYAPGREPAVRGMDLAVPARGHTAIVGPSGAGKTSVFSLILRFLTPESGEIRLGGTPYDELTIDEVRARLSYVEQETPVLPGSIRENLLFSHPEASEADIWAALESVHLDSAIRALDEGLDTDLIGSTVSGGQRQRIALARAIVRRPEILLLDEATAQVDGRTEAAIHEVIRSIAADSAVVTIAHRLSTVLDADTILVMEDGVVRARGTHSELMNTDSLYRELVAALRIGDNAALTKPSR